MAGLEAFLTTWRSVFDALKTDLADAAAPPGAKAWVKTWWDSRWASDPLIKALVDARNVVVHRGRSPLRYTIAMTDHVSVRETYMITLRDEAGRIVREEYAGPDPPVYPEGMDCPSGDPTVQFMFENPAHPVIHGREVRQACDDALEIYAKLLRDLEAAFPV